SDFAFVHGHQGGKHDLAVGLVDFRNRHLDTSLGRWTRQDPLGFVDGINTYLYVGANPLSAVDSSGLKTIWIGENGSGGLGGDGGSDDGGSGRGGGASCRPLSTTPSPRDCAAAWFNRNKINNAG